MFDVKEYGPLVKALYDKVSCIIKNFFPDVILSNEVDDNVS
jgi:hypothetical protein